MEMPSSYNETPVAGEYPKLELGPHYLVIKKVVDTVTKEGMPMAVVYFDTAPNDTQPGFYSSMFQRDTRPDKKWPNNGTIYIQTEYSEGHGNGVFKGFVVSVEKSNPGFKTQWGPGFAEPFKGKLVGGNFRTEIDVYKEKEYRSVKLAFFIPNNDVPTAKVPNEYETKRYRSWKEEMANNMSLTEETPFDDFSGTPFEGDDVAFA